MRATEDRLEIIQIQLICQVLDVKLDIHRYAFLLHQVGAHGKIQNRPRFDAPTLKVDFVEQTRVESFGNEVSQGRSRLDVNRHAGIIPSIKTRVDSGRSMRVTDLKLRFVSLIVIVSELQSVQKKVLRILTKEQSARNRRYAKRPRIGIRDEGVKAMDLR